jgi:hypothetical protein
MKTQMSALSALAFFSVVTLSAATRIDDPKTFVTDVYRRFVAAQSTHSSYAPPEDIYTVRLAKLIREDSRKAHGEVGCLDFVFWTGAQDWKLSRVAVTSADEAQEHKTVIARFVNEGEPQEIHFDFRRDAGRWLLDDAHSVLAPRWTLSELLKCTP